MTQWSKYSSNKLPTELGVMWQVEFIRGKRDSASRIKLLLSKNGGSDLAPSICRRLLNQVVSSWFCSFKYQWYNTTKYRNKIKAT